jgi:MFS family permease
MGVMASALAFGYMLAVPVLTTLTDRIDARLVLAAGSAVSGFATIGFGVFAEGLVSATLIWGIAGIGFAGAYMPGLKALTDRLPPGDTSRSVTLYTASFSVGVGLSFLVLLTTFADQAGVVLPAPFGPIIALRSPGMSVSETPCTARKPPKLFDRLLSSSSGSPRLVRTSLTKGAGCLSLPEGRAAERSSAGWGPL